MNTLREALQDYLAMRRALGFRLHDAGVGLQDFVSFLERKRTSHITTRLALEWAQRPTTVQPAHWAQRLTFVRGFARYRSATDPQTEIPPWGLLPFQPKRARRSGNTVWPPRSRSAYGRGPDRVALVRVDRAEATGCHPRYRGSPALYGEGAQRALHAADQANDGRFEKLVKRTRKSRHGDGVSQCSRSRSQR